MNIKTVCTKCGIDNCDCEELQQYAKEAAWNRFTQEVLILKEYRFKEDQLMHYIRFMYERQ